VREASKRNVDFLYVYVLPSIATVSRKMVTESPAATGRQSGRKKQNRICRYLSIHSKAFSANFLLAKT
jgi:hypothetical protein